MRRSLFSSFSVLSILCVLLVLSGCVTGQPYRRPPITAPEQHRGQPGPADAASLADQPWWEIFQDDALKNLIAEALRNGYDVRLAAWRMEEARASAGIVRSQNFPAVQGQVQAGYGRRAGETGGLVDV